jgi:hypothetical protein
VRGVPLLARRRPVVLQDAVDHRSAGARGGSSLALDHLGFVASARTASTRCMAGSRSNC